MKRIVILGGSFNPVHNGHLRLALEMGEALQADRLDFVPSFRPPHKAQSGLLPFELRVEALRLALRGLDGAHINLFEAGLEEPSYSIYTLLDYAKREPEAELFFALGLYDFAQLHKWYRWEELILHANLVVAPRQGGNADDFMKISRTLWPGCTAGSDCRQPLCLNPQPGREKGQTKQAYYLPVPRLDISASLIRQKWLSGHSLDFLLPNPVINLLNEKQQDVRTAWQFSENSRL